MSARRRLMQDASSPNFQKSSTFTKQRISTMTSRLEGTKVKQPELSNKKALLDQEISLLEENSENLKKSHEDFFEELSEQLRIIDDQFLKEEAAQKSANKKQLQILKTTENRIENRVEEEYSRRQQAEKSMLMSFEQQLSAIRNDLASIQAKMTDDAQKRSSIVRQELQTLFGKIEEERKQRSEAGVAVISAFAKDMTELQHSLAQNMKDREDSRKRILSKFEEVSQYYQDQLQKEKEEREKAEDALFKALEDAFAKIQDELPA